MTLKEIAKLLETNIQTIPNLVSVLKRGFEEAEAGSAVEVTQVVTSGTKIATIKVDNETTDIYTPESSASLDYSTTPAMTGAKWIDGKDVYHVVIDLEEAVSISQTNTFVELANVAGLNIDTLICGWTKPTKIDTFDPTALEVASGKLKGSFTAQWSVKTIYIQYTITTE